jgi:hypothetical protein
MAGLINLKITHRLLQRNRPKATLCERLIPHCERFNWRNGNYGISRRDQTGPVAKCAELRRNRVQTNLELCSGPRAGSLLQLLSAKWEVLPGGTDISRFGGATHADGHDNRCRHRQSVFQIHGNRRYGPGDCPPPVEASLHLGVFLRSCSSAWSVSRPVPVTPLVARAAGTWPHRAVDAAGLRQALRQAAEERCGRR